MVEALKKNGKISRKGPVVLVIMDGVGFGKYKEGDAVASAMTNNLDQLYKDYPWTKLKAHGLAVGLPSDADMGNSEVGHNAMGCGRVFAQGAALVSNSINSGDMFKGSTWVKLIENCKKNSSTLHFIGLLSDGNVHSHIDHLKAMVKQAKVEGVKKVRIHALLDGRDVGEMSALEYFDPFTEYLESLNDASFDARIASGGGRMVITMDRYNANWDMVKKGWETHVLGEGRQFASAHEAIETLRAETGAIDQDLPPFVIAENGKPVGTIEDGDSVILFNFRGDRALEITKAFEAENLTEFDRKRRPNVEYAGMMEYDGDLHVPAQFLVSPPSIDRTMAEYLCATGLKQFSISETQKFGHVTYFFNGNKTGKFNEELEEYVEIPSDIVPFEERPWMKCAEIADRVIKEIESGKWDLIKLNFPNGDMVGHTGVFEAVVCSMEAMDLQIGRIWNAIKKAGGVMVVTADHGNADDMYEHGKDGSVKLKKDGDPKSKTSHSLNPVPCIVCDSAYNGEYSKELKTGLGISSIPATLMNLLGYDAPADYDSSVLTLN
ncbi:MAG: 2,3-bisphosphoglycerate-independent phosphoglycerate mutase [Spirochaetales bacterium]|uniref:2,3-bisphosphoglycerate-independent phosphoglycerate mutase n=1 Tax=Bullifex sp. TaxID=2815808 RepID=UPI002A509D83|nr:2,3-bisphosphoglycerate-independent phosphoglycerate mutase [Bullifex sp.]MDD5973736.1 2,3-bisphosphoglycerate-independent phosphoglycerate mutase [Spirochaetales bacterium]MDD7270451.1 2,3-bisphosphoglycerate-independent phosphoglycerate mutase [Spirochaetales bacterium]MDY4068196.1 2,3-bisphosphoglycerate-independent phosphoglycerate mutase [Bullifex sp.]